MLSPRAASNFFRAELANSESNKKREIAISRYAAAVLFLVSISFTTLALFMIRGRTLYMTSMQIRRMHWVTLGFISLATFSCLGALKCVLSKSRIVQRHEVINKFTLTELAKLIAGNNDPAKNLADELQGMQLVNMVLYLQEEEQDKLLAFFQHLPSKAMYNCIANLTEAKLTEIEQTLGERFNDKNGAETLAKITRGRLLQIKDPMDHVITEVVKRANRVARDQKPYFYAGMFGCKLWLQRLQQGQGTATAEVFDEIMTEVGHAARAYEFVPPEEWCAVIFANKNAVEAFVNREGFNYESQPKWTWESLLDQRNILST